MYLTAVITQRTDDTKLWSKNKESLIQTLSLNIDLNDQNLFHSTIDAPPGMPGVSKNLDNQTEVHSGKLEH